MVLTRFKFPYRLFRYALGKSPDVEDREVKVVVDEYSLKVSVSDEELIEEILSLEKEKHEIFSLLSYLLKYVPTEKKAVFLLYIEKEILKKR